MSTRTYLYVLFTFCLGYLTSACGGSTPPGITPPTQDLPEIQPQVSPTPTHPILETEIRPVDGMAMVFVPPGVFPMGSTQDQVEDAIQLCQQHYNICNRWYYERETPQHDVSLDGFWMDQTEVTNAQFRRCVEAGSCTEPDTCQKGEPTYSDPTKADHPVVCVNWEGAQAYCQWSGGRLPTEAEWEYAYRGEAGSIYPWGNTFDGTRLNYCDQNCSQKHADSSIDDGYPRTAPAGSFPQGISWSQVFNLSGNVSEWVADWFGSYTSEAATNPTGPAKGSDRMVKGGSWFFHPTYARGAARPSVDPNTTFDYLGFRCVLPVYEENAGDTEQEAGPNPVPSSSAPTIDGTMAPGEWEGAEVGIFADGSELLILEAEGELYLGIRSITPGMIAGNVHLHQGDEISILHVSAALGTAIYQKGSVEDAWQQIQDFNWRCRSTSMGESARAEREAFFQEEGWVAVNSRMGTPEELEYRIKLTESTLRLAVNFIKTSDTNLKIPWPPDLEDNVILPTPGGLPTTLLFSPETWGLLEFPKLEDSD